MLKPSSSPAALWAVLGVLVAAFMASPAYSVESCVICHSSSEFMVKNKKLFEYFNSFQQSIHGVIGLECSDCHGGVVGTDDLAEAHVGVMDPVRFDNIPAMCGECHEDQRDSFYESRHYKLLMDDGSAPNCVTCHGAMDMDFYFTSLVRTTCTFCHNPSEGIAPEVPDRAEYILSKMNVIKGYRAFVKKFQKDEVALASIEESYARLTESWHLFDLHRVEVETEFLLNVLREEKAKALKARRENRQQSPE